MMLLNTYITYLNVGYVCAYQSVQKAAMANSALTKVSETWCKGQPWTVNWQKVLGKEMLESQLA